MINPCDIIIQQGKAYGNNRQTKGGYAKQSQKEEAMKLTKGRIGEDDFYLSNFPYSKSPRGDTRTSGGTICR